MRVRDDLLTVSIGPKMVAVLKDTAVRQGLPVSQLVREWARSLADDSEGADNGSE